MTPTPEPTEKKESWEKEFDKREDTEFVYQDYGCDGAEECCGQCGGPRINTNGIKAFIKEIETRARQEEWERCVAVLDQDHLDQHHPQTCIGYGNALSDLINKPPAPNTKSEEH